MIKNSSCSVTIFSNISKGEDSNLFFERIETKVGKLLEVIIKQKSDLLKFSEPTNFMF